MKLAAKGFQREIELSRQMHKFNIPVLISSEFLRTRHCGQIDLAYFNGKKVQLIEVKHRDSYGVSSRQRSRLKNSVSLVCKFFTCPVELSVHH